MKIAMFLGSALLLTTPSIVRGAESGEPATLPAEPAGVAEPAASAESTAPDSATTPNPGPEAAALDPGQSQPVATNPALAPASQPEPYTGWRRGVRAPMYVSMMLSVG